MAFKLTGNSRRDYEKLSTEYINLKDENRILKENNRQLVKDLERARDQNTELKISHAAEIEEKDAIIKELKNRLEHELALKEHDGSNTGIPTSQTPIAREKHIPNSRTKSGLKKGGQIGHKKHILEPPSDDEIDEIITHELNNSEVCPTCGSSDYRYTGTSEFKYVYDIEVNVKRIRHDFYVYKCSECGEMIRSKISPVLWAKCQYGSTVQAFILSMANTANSPMNKTALLLTGMTDGVISPSEGYIAKLQKRASKLLQKFKADLKALLITRLVVYWDDTVIFIMTKRACLRFYGDEEIAYYTAHSTKGNVGLDEDRILILLTKDTSVMHDHNRTNYNEKYCFINIECNQHLQRDLQKNSDDSGHSWSVELKDHISTTIHERKEAIERGENSFTKEYIERFDSKLDKILEDAVEENKENENRYYTHDEAVLIKRITEYRDNYFMWVKDFSLPTTNNLSERALRCGKTHMKVSGQFESEKTARYYADIKTYTETCRRNGINEIEALKRLCEGNPYTVQEIFG